MFKYYLSRGHKLSELISLSNVERLFLISCMELDIKEENEKYQNLFGGRQ